MSSEKEMVLLLERLPDYKIKETSVNMDCLSLYWIYLTKSNATDIQLVSEEAATKEWAQITEQVFEKKNECLAENLSQYECQICGDEHYHTKRKVLQTIASQWDAYNINAPLLNRSRLFLHRLQIDKTLDWDTVLSSELLSIT